METLTMYVSPNLVQYNADNDNNEPHRAGACRLMGY